MKLPFHRVVKEGQEEVQRWTWIQRGLILGQVKKLLLNKEGGKIE
jgi:hypothetical protein